ncbi:MAG: PEP-CTERM sorting domain-containing protein [Proteobacteria bacterium]|jgi:hypothetical protein|nr:PEP-CTERM sorting domain-containing protein [Pseudomonadota bacterium]
MKFEMKKSHIAVALALCGTFATAVNAAPTVISSGLTSATIDDAGYFSSSSPLGMSYNGREFVNLGTWASNWSLNANGGSVAIADEVTSSNPLATTTFGIGGSVTVTTNFGGGGGGWALTETITIPTDGHIAVGIILTNNTGATATGVQWGVGFDPDQGVPAGLGFGTTNEILALGGDSAVRATSLDGYNVTLHNTTSASAFSIAPYIDLSTCCSPVNPALMLAAGQAVGSYGFADNSINLAYDLGSIGSGHSVAFGYEYILAVPEPETYAMLLAGLGLIGFSARRRISA